MTHRAQTGGGTVELDGASLTLEDVGRIATDRTVRVVLNEQASERVSRSREFVEGLLASGERIYGVTTGFGRLAEVVISPEQQSELQVNLIRSHASGLGAPLSEPEVRAVMTLRANALARGNSGCRPVVVERLVEYLNLGIIPHVPEVGSVGASGDLAPLAHVALALMGEGEVIDNGERTATAGVLERHGIQPLELQAKEGLALINGTQATTGLGLLALLAAERAAHVADVAGAMSLEGLRGTPEAFRAEVHEARPHPGQKAVAEHLCALITGSEIRESHRHDDVRIQDAYSLRCMPQVHGATRDTLSYIRQVLEREANSTTDNPLVFAEAAVVVSAGNFHAQVVAQALDYMSIALADLASISERRTERLLNPDLSGLPAFLAREPGLQSGLMIAQVAVVDILAEMRMLAHPVSVDSVPTSANQEDHVSMGMAAARKVRRSVECLEYVLAVEFVCAAQALEYRRPLTSSPALERAHAEIRRRVAPLDGDRSLAADIEATREAITTGALTL